MAKASIRHRPCHSLKRMANAFAIGEAKWQMTKRERERREKREKDLPFALALKSAKPSLSFALKRMANDENPSQLSRLISIPKKIFFILESQFCWSWVPWPSWSPLPLPTTPICLWPPSSHLPKAKLPLCRR